MKKLGIILISSFLVVPISVFAVSNPTINTEAVIQALQTKINDLQNQEATQETTIQKTNITPSTKVQIIAALKRQLQINIDALYSQMANVYTNNTTIDSLKTVISTDEMNTNPSLYYSVLGKTNQGWIVYKATPSFAVNPTTSCHYPVFSIPTGSTYKTTGVITNCPTK